MTDWSVSDFHEVRELGRGAQGRVVLARHATAGTPVAIKYLPRDADPGVKDRFRHEARMLGRVDHPNVARLYRLVEHGQGTAIVMEAVDGVSLKRILAEHGALAPEAALLVLKGSLLGLAAAHAHRVVHRDYKPANVVVRADGLSKLIDFGIAVWTGEGGRAGTPVYMAPEQWRGDPASPATDVYAATCVFYECVTGDRPFRAEGAVALMAAHVQGAVPVDGVPDPLRGLVARGLAKDPADRPSGAAAFTAELEEIAEREYGPDWEHRAIRALAAAAAALAAVFPLAAAGLAPATAAPSAAAAHEAGRGALSMAGKGTASVTGKATAISAAVAVTAAVIGGAAYVASDDSEPGRPQAAGPAATTPPAATSATTGPSTTTGPSATTGPSGTAGPSTPAGPARLGPDGFGAIALGMTEAELRATGLATLTSGAAAPGCKTFDAAPRPGDAETHVYLSRNVGVAMIFGGEGMVTPKGIGIGSTLAELRAAYPATRPDPNGWSTPAPGNQDAYYTSLVRNGEIYQFALRLRDGDCAN